MYKGKFDQKSKKSSSDIREIVSQRNAAPAPQAPKKAAPVKEAPVKEAPARKAPPVQAEPEILRKEAPKKAPPAPKTAQPPKKQPAEPVKQPKKETKKKKGPRIGGVIFYTLYFLFILLFAVALLFGLNIVKNWLITFEYAQPDLKAQQVFTELFADPNWGELYDAAGIQDTAYEGKEEFVAYMEAKVGDSELTYQETSAGLSGDKKFFVKLGDEVIGYFILDDNRETLTAMPDWKLGEVSLNCEYNKSILVQCMDGQTILVNGVALGEEHTIQIGTTLAEKYIPENLHGPRIYTQQLTGLMCEPEVTAVDADGNAVAVSYNADTGMYVAQTSVNTPSDDVKTLAYNTAKAYSLRMINQTHQMGKYFDTTSESYKAITGTATFMQTWYYRSHKFGEATYSGYYRYSDRMYSIHVDLPMYVTRTDGTVREYNVDHTFFYEKKAGDWKCTIMTNVDVQEQIGEVRLTFVLDNAVLSSEFFATDASEISMMLYFC